MSVVVAFKYKDGMIIGADKRVTMYGRLHEDSVSKIFPTKFSGHAVGCVGYLRHANLLSIREELIDCRDILEGTTIDLSYMVGVTVPTLIEYLKDANGLDNPEGFCAWGSEMLYVTKERIFHIGSDFAVMEHSPWAAIGCGMEMVSGVLSNYDEKDFEKLKEKEAISLMESCISYGCSKDNMVSQDFEYILLKK